MRPSEESRIGQHVQRRWRRMRRRADGQTGEVAGCAGGDERRARGRCVTEPCAMRRAMSGAETTTKMKHILYSAVRKELAPSWMAS